MAELSAVPFSALPTSDDGYTLLNDNGIVHRSSKKLSELVGEKTSSFLTQDVANTLYAPISVTEDVETLKTASAGWNKVSDKLDSIESNLANKKDKQTELNFNGSATKTIKSITQNTNGEINVEYEDIDLPKEVPNLEITSEDNSIDVVESTDSQTNTKTFDLSVTESVKSKIKDIKISSDTIVIIGD